MRALDERSADLFQAGRSTHKTHLPPPACSFSGLNCTTWEATERVGGEGLACLDGAEAPFPGGPRAHLGEQALLVRFRYARALVRHREHELAVDGVAGVGAARVRDACPPVGLVVSRGLRG